MNKIEQSIKSKVEKYGIPLKDWDIQINYGIKTGCNEAFIISTEKKEEILAACKTAEERNRTAEIIRPILRGRDIKRYTYDWAGLWLIATFPAKKYNINNYPAIKDYLLSYAKSELLKSGYEWVAEKYLHEYCKKKLSQTGEIITINGKQILIDGKASKARKKTGNKWFETQDSIAYWDDFDKQKIVWKRIGSILRFSYDDNGCLPLDSICFATGSHIKFLTAFLNSKVGNYLLQGAPKTGTGDLLISVQAVSPIKVPAPDVKIEREIEKHLDVILCGKNKSDKTRAEEKVEEIANNLYHFTKEEQDFIKNSLK